MTGTKDLEQSYRLAAAKTTTTTTTTLLLLLRRWRRFLTTPTSHRDKRCRQPPSHRAVSFCFVSFIFLSFFLSFFLSLWRFYQGSSRCREKQTLDSLLYHLAATSPESTNQQEREARSRTLFLPRLLPRFSYVSTRHRHLALEFQVPRASLRRESKTESPARAPREEKYLSSARCSDARLGSSTDRPVASSSDPRTTAPGERTRSCRGKKARGARKSCIDPPLPPPRSPLSRAPGSTHRYARRIHRGESSV